MEHPIVYSPHLWEEVVKTLDEALTSTDDGHHGETIAEMVNRLYIMFLDAKYSTGSGDNLRKTWTSLVDIICKVLRTTLELEGEVPVSAVPLRLLQNLPRDLSFSRDLSLRYQTVISFLCDYIECSKSEVRSSELCLKDVVPVVNCLTAWSIEYGDITIHRQTLLRCVQVLEHWMENSSRDSISSCLSWIISEKYQYLLKHLCDRQSGTGTFYSKFCERDLVDKWKLDYSSEGATVRYLLFEGARILCLINPPKTNAPVLYLVVRSPYLELSFHWLRYESDPLTGAISLKDREKVPRPKGLVKGHEEDKCRREEMPVPRLSVVLKEKLQTADYGIVTVSSIQELLRRGDSVKEYVTETELVEHIEHQKRTCDSLPKPPPPEDIKIPDCVENSDSSRLFLAHLGILSPEMFHSSGQDGPPVILLKDSSKLQKMLEELDDISTRECQTVMVLYMKTGQKTLEQILKNTNILVPNQRFQRFVSSLGNKIVDICTFTGWTGLKPCSDNIPPTAPVTFPYYSDRFNEVLFSIPNLLPPKALNNMSSDREAGSINCTRVMCQEDLLKNMIWDAPVNYYIQSNIPKIIIVWTESSNDIPSFIFENVASHLKCDEDTRFSIIFVCPLSGGFVRIVSKEGGIAAGESYVVRDYISQIVIREMCLAVRETSLFDQLSRVRPVNRRQACIDKIARENGCVDQENGYFDCFFNRH